jgi:hypothetical protein
VESKVYLVNSNTIHKQVDLICRYEEQEVEEVEEVEVLVQYEVRHQQQEDEQYMMIC